ncbi:flavodoxin family protein [Desulfospira joergensenii]|uniref:flavodoxin family protein n=1 Tax=Desulfospira joergensenii TaxID=53329 RepID=UPI0003B6651F|nr:flavodoxin family protein [Desulfospira joergensenii]
MKVLLLQGGAKKKGNTAKVLGWVEEELKSSGHEVETVYLHSKTLKGCMGCAKCKDIPDKIGCAQKDDAPEILGKMIHAQAVVFSSPLYFWGVNAQLKAVIDRTYSLYTNANTPDHASLVEGQRQALLVTGAGPWDNNAEGAFTAFGRMQKYHKAVHAGELFVGGCTTPAAMDSSVKERAVEFARKLTA